MSIPSLRQQMINEALDYHMNMNHVVFNRERKHVETMGQQVLDPTKSDIIIEGQIRDRISRIMTAVQKLVQFVSFEKQPPSGGPGGPGGGPGGPGGGPGGPRGDDTTTPGNTGQTAPSSRSQGFPSSVKMELQNAMTDIVSNYNSLCEYIDLQNRQKAFTQRDIANIDGMVKQLIDPIKMSIASLSRLFDKPKTDQQWMDYTRMYNAISAVISSIEIGMPLQKVSMSLLTERVPIKEELIKSQDYDPSSPKNQKYIRRLYNQISKEQKIIDRMPQHTQLERKAKELAQKSLDAQRQKLKSSGLVSEVSQIPQQVAPRASAGLRDRMITEILMLEQQGSIPPKTATVVRGQIDEARHIDELAEVADTYSGYFSTDVLELIQDVLLAQQQRDEFNRAFEPPEGSVGDEEQEEEAYEMYEDLTEELNNDLRIPLMQSYEQFIARMNEPSSNIQKGELINDFLTEIVSSQRTLSTIVQREVEEGTLQEGMLEDIKSRSRDLLNEYRKSLDEFIEEMRELGGDISGRPQEILPPKSPVIVPSQPPRQELQEILPPKSPVMVPTQPKQGPYETPLMTALKIFDTNPSIANFANIQTELSTLRGENTDARKTYEYINRMYGKQFPSFKEKVKSMRHTSFYKYFPEGSKGKGKPKKGGHVHKTEKFDDDAELAPYLTKHLKPSKYRKDVPPIVSSSEESSGDEGESSDMEINELRLGKGKKKGKKTRKQIEDIAMLMSMPMKEAAAIIEKKKRGGAKKEVMKPVQKPAIKDSGADKDLWFL